MRVLITGERGFIATNLVRAFENLGHEIFHLGHFDSLTFLNLHRLQTGEVCVYRNTEEVWYRIFNEFEIELVVHNAAVVGTDVVALNPNDSCLSNVTGTYNICRAAEKAGIPVSYMGTTVIYDTPSYQDKKIIESSDRSPNTLYGALKLSGEHIVRSHCSKWNILRPLFCYGGVGDNNSLIAKSFYASLHDISRVDMFLDPEKSKDYMRVEDFCDAVATACHLGLWNDDYNVSAENERNTGQILDVMSEICNDDLTSRVKWHPETDYLGNHLLTSVKFREASGWSPKFNLYDGLCESWKSIQNQTATSEYNPLKYLEEADKKGIDLTQFY